MKPAPFDYARPAGLSEALQLLERRELAARPLAGGQSLGPMLNLRLVQPRLVVELGGIVELVRVEETADAVTLGACISHADIEDGRVPDPTGGPLKAVAGGIAYRAVRNRGTIGGSLCHADPAADWVSVLACLGAEALIRGTAGHRSLPVQHFVIGAFETALQPGELLEAVRIPRLSRQARWGYCKILPQAGRVRACAHRDPLRPRAGRLSPRDWGHGWRPHPAGGRGGLVRWRGRAGCSRTPQRRARADFPRGERHQRRDRAGTVRLASLKRAAAEVAMR